MSASSKSTNVKEFVCIVTEVRTQKNESTISGTFSPPDKFAIFFQLFFGGLTLKTTPSEKGSRESTSSSSASPPNVIIYVHREKVGNRSEKIVLQNKVEIKL